MYLDKERHLVLQRDIYPLRKNLRERNSTEVNVNQAVDMTRCGEYMYKIFKNVVALSLILSMLFVNPAVVAASDTQGHWAMETIESWVADGLVSGYEDGSFRPDQEITRAEFFTLLDNIIEAEYMSDMSFVDVDEEDWYYGAVMCASAIGLTEGYPDGTFKPGKAITREEVAVIVTRLLDYSLETSTVQASLYLDSPSIANWAEASVEMMLEKGFITGYPDNTIRPQKSITRAETVALLSRVFGLVINEAGTYGPDSGMEIINGAVTVTTPDVVLRNTEIKGDLYIAEGVGDGELTLENVIINGDTIVKGGGENSIYFDNVTVGGTLKVHKLDGQVRIVATGNSNVAVTVLDSGAILVEEALEGGGFKTITIPADFVDGSEVLLDGDFDSVDINASNVDLMIKDGANVENIVARGQNLKISGKGSVASVEVKANGVQIDTSGTRVMVDPGVEGTNADGEPLDGGEEIIIGEETPVPAASGGGGGGGGGGGAGGNIGGSSGSTPGGSSGSTPGDGSSGGDQSGSTDDGSGDTSGGNQGDGTDDGDTDSTTGSAITIDISIVIDQGSTLLDLGDKLSLEATVTSGPALDIDVDTDITWQVLDESVATITQSGVVTAISVGATKVKAMVDGYEGFDTLDISVIDTSAVYTVTFDAGKDAPSVTPQQVIYDGNAISVAVSRYGYEFDGWYQDGKLFNFGTAIRSDIDLIARWDEVTTDIDIDFRDPRFADGYPRAEVTDSDFINLYYKVEGASVDDPATIYVLVNYQNPSVIADSQSIMKGHTGINSFVLGGRNYIRTLTDEGEGIIFTLYDGDMSEYDHVTCSFVIDMNDQVSTYPTVLSVTGTSVSEPGSSTPVVSSAYISKARDEVAIVFSELLDPSNLPSLSSFSFLGIGGEQNVTDLRLETYWDTLGTYSRIVISVQGIGEEDDVSNLKVSYDGNKLKGIGMAGKKVEDFSHDVLISEAYLLEVNYSDDKEHIFALAHGMPEPQSYSIYFDNDLDNEEVVIEYDTTLVEYGNVSLIIELEEGPVGDIIGLEIHGEDHFGDPVVIRSVEGQLLSIPELEISWGEYSLENKTMEIIFTDSILWRVDHIRTFGTSFNVSVNGELYTLTNSGELIWEDGDIKYNDVAVFDENKLPFEIEAGDVVRIQYDPKYSDNSDSMVNRAWKMVEVTGEWIDVIIVD